MALSRITIRLKLFNWVLNLLTVLLPILVVKREGNEETVVAPTNVDKQRNTVFESNADLNVFNHFVRLNTNPHFRHLFRKEVQKR